MQLISQMMESHLKEKLHSQVLKLRIMDLCGPMFSDHWCLLRKKYFMRAYAISEDFVVYGNTIEFISLGGKAPIVKDFFPATGTWDDTVTVVGENFSDQNRNNIVKFGEHTATVLRSSNDTLLVS